jgi:hypothetical protein
LNYFEIKHTHIFGILKKNCNFAANKNLSSMKTEINGDWKAYAKRFKLPSRNTLLLPLKRFGICLVIQSLASCTGSIVILLVSSLVIGTFLYAAYKEFWNVVLEEAKGLGADLLMWLYYAILFALTIVAPICVANYYLHFL